MMEEKALRGIPWAVLSYAGTKFGTVITTIVLARLLVPEDFGLISLAMVILGIVNLFSDLGMGSVLVLRRDLDDVARGTVLSLLLIFGAVLAVVLAAVAPWVASLFQTPRLARVLTALAVTVFVSGLTWFYESLLQGELEFRKRFVSQAAQSISYAAFAIPLAMLGAGVWSLVIGQTAAVAVYAVVLLWITPFRVRIALDMRAAREVIASGVGFLLQGGVALVKQNLDYLSIGRVMGVTSLGFYSLSFRLAELPYWSIADPVAKVTFPGFARMRHQGEDITVPYLTSLRLVALVACPVGTILAASADPFVRAIYGEKWVPMIVPLSILGIWAAVRPVQGMTGWLLNSFGQARISGLVSAITVGPLLVAVVVAVRLGGLEAVAWVMLTDAVVSACLLAYLAQVRTGVSLRLQWAALWHVVVGCAAAWVAAKLGKSVAGGASATIALVCSGFFGFMAYVVTVWLLDASALRSNVVLVRSVLSRSASSRT